MRILLKKQPGTEPVELIRDEAVLLEELVEEYRSELPYRVLIARVKRRGQRADRICGR